MPGSENIVTGRTHKNGKFAMPSEELQADISESYTRGYLIGHLFEKELGIDHLSRVLQSEFSDGIGNPTRSETISQPFYLFEDYGIMSYSMDVDIFTDIVDFDPSLFETGKITHTSHNYQTTGGTESKRSNYTVHVEETRLECVELNDLLFMIADIHTPKLIDS